MSDFIQSLTATSDSLQEQGYSLIERLYSDSEVARILERIEATDQSSLAFRKTKELFAVRRFLHEIPGISDLIFTSRFKMLVTELFGENYFCIKSIYFDKPATSNWFVAWHQDLTVSVDTKKEVPGYGPWTVKPGQYAVQPPISVLENIYTIRIHLDDTNEENGALKIVPGSHLKGIYRPETIDWKTEIEVSCTVSAGGAMIMQPLLLHSSARTSNGKRRRVIHLELSDAELADGIHWSEKIVL